MKIYAVRDRLINYYMNPFAAPDDQNVMAAVSSQISNPEDKSALAQAPHHFEIWSLGELKEDGHIEAKKEWIADCASLIRTGVRKTEPGIGNSPGGPTTTSTGTTEVVGTTARTKPKPLQGKKARGHNKGTQAHKRPAGSHRARKS